MKLLISLCALVAACLATPNGYAYSAYSPYQYNPYPAPYSYFYAPQPYSRFAYSVAETAPQVTYYNAFPAPAVNYVAAPPAVKYVAPAPAVKYVAPAPAIVAAPSISVPVIAPAPVKSQYHAQDSLGQARYGHDEPGQSHHAIQDAAGNKFGTFSYVKPDGTVSITQYSADHEGYKVASNDLPVAPGHPAAAEPAVPLVPVAPIVPAPSPVLADVPVVAVPAVEASDDTIEVENVEIRAKREDKSDKPAPAHKNLLRRRRSVSEQENLASKSHTKRQAPIFYSAYSAFPYSYSAYPYAYSAYPYSYSVSPYSYSGYAYSTYTPYSYTPVTSNGYLADTPEVAAAKAAHFAHHAIALSRLRRDVNPKVKRSPVHTPASTSPLVPAPVVVPVVPAPGYAPGYTAQVYSRPVDPSVPIVPLAPVPVTTVVKTPASGAAYAYKV